MQFKLEKVTPAKAKIILKNNPKNRAVDTRHVAFLAKQMTNDEWQDNGQTVVISKTGALIDGQHRLNAIIESGVTLTIPICTGVDDVAIHSIDTGNQRKMKDIFALEGHKNCTTKSGIVSKVYQWRHKNLGANSATDYVRPSNDQLWNIYLELSKEIDHISSIHNNFVPMGLIHGAACFGALLVRKRHGKGKFDEFLRLCTEGGDYKRSPTHLMPKWLAERKRLGEIKYRNEDLHVFLYCYNLWLKDEEVVRIHPRKIMEYSAQQYKLYKI